MEAGPRTSQATNSTTFPGPSARLLQPRTSTYFFGDCKKMCGELIGSCALNGRRPKTRSKHLLRTERTAASGARHWTAEFSRRALTVPYDSAATGKRAPPRMRHLGRLAWAHAGTDTEKRAGARVAAGS